MRNSSSLAIPFAGRSTADDVLSGVDLAGKTILITGCNSGIGFETMRALQAHGAHVIALARSEQSARDAIDRAGGSGMPLLLRRLVGKGHRRNDSAPCRRPDDQLRRLGLRPGGAPQPRRSRRGARQRDEFAAVHRQVSEFAEQVRWLRA